ncbi:hypothetical protein Droror1_Dr00005707 [Drosera rotundifolia]
MAESSSSDESPTFFVAVHVGAGYHAPSNEKALRSAMQLACLAAAAVLTRIGPSITLHHLLLSHPFPPQSIKMAMKLSKTRILIKTITLTPNHHSSDLDSAASSLHSPRPPSSSRQGERPWRHRPRTHDQRSNPLVLEEEARSSA